MAVINRINGYDAFNIFWVLSLSIIETVSRNARVRLELNGYLEIIVYIQHMILAEFIKIDCYCEIVKLSSHQKHREKPYPERRITSNNSIK